MMADLDDDYMRERSSDLADVSGRGLQNCTVNGKNIDIYANIGRVEEVYDALCPRR